MCELWAVVAKRVPPQPTVQTFLQVVDWWLGRHTIRHAHPQLMISAEIV
jgi:hypothetical protein